LNEIVTTRRGETIDTSPYIEQTETSLRFREDTPEEVWAAVTRKLLGSRDALNWWIGDAITQGEAAYGERYSQEVVETTALTPATLMNLVYVSRAVPPENRRSDLSYGHHAEVASVADKERQRQILAECAPPPGERRARVSRDDLRIRLRTQRQRAALEAGEDPVPVTVNDLSFGEMREMASERLDQVYAGLQTEDAGEPVEGEVVEEGWRICPACGGSGRVE
jgi:hypothetical protein